MGYATNKLLKNLCTLKLPPTLSHADIVKLLSDHLNPKLLEMTERQYLPPNCHSIKKSITAWYKASF